ncbi:MAG: hypothetical protein AAF311_03310 [Pseudomonadota bacterium]
MKRTPLSQAARNEIAKAKSSWYRTISLGLMAAAIIDPVRDISTLNPYLSGTAVALSLLTYRLSIHILKDVED